MSRQDLSAMLAKVAEPVQQESLAARAWAKSRQIRRRRAVVGAAVAVLLVSASITLYRLPDRAAVPVPPATPTPAPTATGTAKIYRLPTPIPDHDDTSPYWPDALTPPADAPPASQLHFNNTVLLFQPNSEGPIYAYGYKPNSGGTDFHWVRLDVPLVDTRDAGGNRATPLDVNSLGPMGNSAAFAQPDELVVVDLMEGSTRRIPLAGLNEEVAWVPSGRHLFVSSDTQTWLAATDRVIGPAAASAFDMTPLVDRGKGLTTMTFEPSEKDSLVVHHYDDEGRAEISRFTVDMTTAPAYRLSNLAPRGWRADNLIAQAASGQAGDRPGDFVIVVDERTESITHVLDLGSGRNKGCCRVMGTGTDDVLVYTEQEGLLFWQLSTGAVTRVFAYAPGALSIGYAPCHYEVTIQGETSTCMT